VGLFARPGIDAGVQEFLNTPDAVLLDVRTPPEYAEGRIEGSVNIPLDMLGNIDVQIPDKNTPLFVYCRSGARSGQAVSHLKRAGYRNAKNIGGIMNYHGKVVR
jgi:phage shock protein E